MQSMSEVASPLLPIFRSQNQLRLLAYIFTHGDRSHTAAELARATGISEPTVTREVNRLLGAGIVVGTKRGRAKLIEPNREVSYFEDLEGLLIKTAGPPFVLGNLLRPLAGIQSAFIYGSWARRFLGEPGDYPRDIDLVVVGNPDIDAVYDAVSRAEKQLALSVNPTIVSSEDWARPGSMFLESIANGPLVPVIE